MIDILDIETRVRRALDEYTLSGEFIGTDTDFEDVLSSEFSTEDIFDRAMDSARYIAARVRASHLRDLVSTVNLTDETKLVPSGGAIPFYRVLISRVRLDVGGTEYYAQRRTFGAHASLSGRVADPSHPLFVYADNVFLLSAGTGATNEISSDDVDIMDGVGVAGNLKADVVSIPLPAGTEGAYYDGISTAPNISWSSINATELGINMDSKFLQPIINGILFSCFMTKRKAEMAILYRKKMMETLTPFLQPRFREDQIPELKNL